MKILAAAILILLLSACGGSSDRVLHFTGRDETEAGFRDRMQAAKRDDARAWLQLCAAVNGIPAEKAAALLVGDEPVDITQFAGATPRPGQKPNADDVIRGTKIIQEECKR